MTLVSRENRSRSGLTRVELFVAGGVLALLLFVAQQALVQSREAARRHTCTDHLRQLHLALMSYHDSFSVLPPAATWRTPIAAEGNHWLRISDATAVAHQNWFQLLLPHLPAESLANAVAAGVPIGAPENSAIRTAQPAWARCPSDDHAGMEKPFRARSPLFGEIEFARGNYSINGGVQRMALSPGTTADPVPGGIHVIHNSGSGIVAGWGNGIAGFNRCFTLSEIVNGLGTTVAIDEVRAGIHPYDPRGTWALGHIGASITWAHGMNGDAGRPNASGVRADDVAGCAELHQLLGEDVLIDQNMPCCSYCSHSEQAAARSRHPGGVHVLTLDGAAHFISDDVDPGLWHVLHSRETPPDVLHGAIPSSPAAVQTAASAVSSPTNSSGVPDSSAATSLTNSIGMQFIRLPPGRFIMGLPDEELNAVFEHDGAAATHWVELTRPVWMGVHEVTRADWAAVVGGSALPELNDQPAICDDVERLPISDISWNDAARFCELLSQLAAETAAGRCYRLPTEAEWEYACRSGSTAPHIYIAERQPGDESGENAMKQPPLPIVPVGSYPPNPFGLCDMRGNVWEWCADWSHPDYYGNSAARDPTGPAHGFLKVVRGADWLYAGQRCTLGFRATEPWLTSPFIGFRVVCEAVGPP